MLPLRARRAVVAAWAVSFGLGGVACTARSKPKVEEKTTGAAPVGAPETGALQPDRVVTATAATLPPAADGEGDAETATQSAARGPFEALGEDSCFPPFDDAAPSTPVEAAGVAFERRGTVLVARRKDADAVTRLGVIGNVKEFTSTNERAIAAYVRFFREKAAEAIVVTGDIGESETDIRQTLKALASGGLPVFAIIGNRESVVDFDGAIAALAAEGITIFNLNRLRLVRFDDHALVTVPGLHDPSYVHAEEGCAYGPEDLEEVARALAAAGRTPIVVSHGPPKQTGPFGIDVVTEGEHVGDAALAALLEKTQVRFVLSSNIQEAGGRATTRDGSKLVRPGETSAELFLNPGGADRTVPWKMNDGEYGHGIVAVATYDGAQASYELLRLPAE